MKEDRDKKSRIIGFGLSSVDLARLLYDKYDFPDDIVITKFERIISQDAWIVNLYSREFPEHSDLDLISTQSIRDDYRYKNEDH